MNEKSPDEIAQIMAPYRARIDALDQALIALLRKRYDVIEEVGPLKCRQGLAPVLQDRVDEVRENAAQMAAACGLDEGFIRQLWAQIIDHSCNLEVQIIEELETRKAS